MTQTQHAESLHAVTVAWSQWQRLTCGSNTIRQRCDIVQRLAEHTARKRRVLDLDPRDITGEEVAAYLSQDHLSQSARATYYRALGCWFGWLHASGRLPLDPMVDLRSPKSPDDDPDPLTLAEVRAVFDGAPAAVRAMMLLAFREGLRAHEVAKFRGDHIRDGEIRILGKGARTCTVPLHDDIADLAARMPTSWWFPSPLRSREHLRTEHVSRVVADRFREVGILHGSIHRLRHTFGSQLQEVVGDTRIVQELMRHRSITSTQRYTRVADTRKRTAMQGLPAISA